MNDVSFRYFDLRKNFQIEDEKIQVGIHVSDLGKIWNVDKIRNILMEKLKFKKTENEVLKELENQIKYCGLYIEPEFLGRTFYQKKTNCVFRFFNNIFSQGPIKEAEITHTTCSFYRNGGPSFKKMT